jgi:hypothetical protein
MPLPGPARHRDVATWCPGSAAVGDVIREAVASVRDRRARLEVSSAEARYGSPLGFSLQPKGADMPNGDDEHLDLNARRREERRAVEEAGGGVSEGFELAEEDLIEHASHGDDVSASRILRDAGTLDEEQSGAVYGEADEEHIPD